MFQSELEKNKIQRLRGCKENGEGERYHSFQICQSNQSKILKIDYNWLLNNKLKMLIEHTKNLK